MRRQGRGGALTAATLAAASLATVLATVLGGCSVPREADLVASGSASGGVRVSPSPALTTSPTATPSASGTPTPTPAPTLTPTPTPTPTAKAVPPTPKAVPGYTLTAAPHNVVNPLAAVTGAADLFGAVTMKSVAQGSTPVGLLFLFAVSPQDVGDPAISALVLPRVAGGVTGGGIKVAMQRFGSQQVAVGTSPTKGTIVLWYDRGVLAVVLGGGDPATVTTYARAYIARSR